MMEILISIVGLVGAGMCVSMYALLATGKINENSLLFYIFNGLGAALILISVAVVFDPGDAGALLQEMVWLLISLAGIYKVVGQRKINKKEAA